MHGLSESDELQYWRERSKAFELERDNLEALVVTTIESALVGPVQVPPSMSAEVARMVNAVRINVTLRERAEKQLEEARRALANERQTSVDMDAVVIAACEYVDGTRSLENSANWYRSGIADAVDQYRNRSKP